MNAKIHVRFGLIFAAIDILLFVVFYSVDHQLESFFFLAAVAALLIAAVVISCFKYTKVTSDSPTVGNIFSNGFRTAVVVAIVFGTVAVLLIKTVPGYKQKVVAEARAGALKAEPTLTEKDLKQNDEAVEQSLVPRALAGIVFPHLILGAMTAGITALALKKQ